MHHRERLRHLWEEYDHNGSDLLIQRHVAVHHASDHARPVVVTIASQCLNFPSYHHNHWGDLPQWLEIVCKCLHEQAVKRLVKL